MAKSLHNIICLEAEWEFRKNHNTFTLKTEPLLHWLKEFHDCDVIYRHIVTKEDLKYYLKYFASHKSKFKKYDIIYISCHGWNHAITLEGKDGEIDLKELAELANGFFDDKIIHFGSCKTMANESETLAFKEETGARMVSGYQVSVDAMTSSIMDGAYLNDIMQYQNVGIMKNKEQSKFWKRYQSLIDDLKFTII